MVRTLAFILSDMELWKASEPFHRGSCDLAWGTLVAYGKQTVRVGGEHEDQGGACGNGSGRRQGQTRSRYRQRMGRRVSRFCVSSENFVLCNFLILIFMLIFIPQSKTMILWEITTNLQENPLVCSSHCSATQ